VSPESSNPGEPAIYPEVKSLELVGDIAYEWGMFHATQQASPTDKPISVQGRFLRVLWITSGWPTDHPGVMGIVTRTEMRCLSFWCQFVRFALTLDNS
jgi:hypothetical protein